MNYTPLKIFYCLALDKDLDKMESYLARMYEADRFKDPARVILYSRIAQKILHEEYNIDTPLLTYAGIRFDDAVLELERIFMHIVDTYDGMIFGKYAMHISSIEISESTPHTKRVPKIPVKYSGSSGNVRVHIHDKIVSRRVHKHGTIGNDDIRSRFTFNFTIEPLQ